MMRDSLDGLVDELARQGELSRRPTVAIDVGTHRGVPFVTLMCGNRGLMNELVGEVFEGIRRVGSSV